ncbi:MAG: flavin reductase family protein [Geminicoccaceae bacterium]
MSVSPAEFTSGMRRLAAGITIVTVAHEGRSGGLTATAVTSLTAQPPRLLVCVNVDAEAHAMITAARSFAVNVLAEPHAALAERFGGRTGVFGQERFQAGSWTTLETGAPILADALAVFDCTLEKEMAASTHTIFIGDVVATAMGEGRPLLWANGGFAGISHPRS